MKIHFHSVRGDSMEEKIQEYVKFLESKIRSCHVGSVFGHGKAVAYETSLKEFKKIFEKETSKNG